MRAKEESSEPAEQGFKYPGPLPREKEIAIVMLADCCEAASRSLQKPSHQKIDALVWEIFRKKIRDGQLDSAELTFKELAKIRKSFVKSLTTMAHGRISYPKDEEDDDEDDLFLASERLAQTQMFTIEEPGQKGG
jgi:membrane-associated HD superfamily phosphohydrolase